MKCNIIKKTIFFARDKFGKEYILTNGRYHSYEELVHENVEGICAEETEWVDDKTYISIPKFEISEVSN